MAEKKSKSLAEMVADFEARQERLNFRAAGMDSQQIEGLVLQMHEDLAEILHLVLGWMQAREEGIPPRRYL